MRLPRFDKAADDRAAPEQGRTVEGPVDLILFEGWCVGARPQPAADLLAPVNDLERDEDRDGSWRRFANDHLSSSYRSLFMALDVAVLLAPSGGFEAVSGWRKEQERKLRDRLAAEGLPPARAMSDAQVERFIAHYERLTRWILQEMPARADVLVRLDPKRRGEIVRM